MRKTNYQGYILFEALVAFSALVVYLGLLSLAVTGQIHHEEEQIKQAKLAAHAYDLIKLQRKTDVVDSIKQRESIQIKQLTPKALEISQLNRKLVIYEE
ncbi:hypothetical protein ACWOAH_04650 [Vagococcus vulneris]|uniref:Type II secretion system protein n=1 Tax=Vagococcus vulneris TaxID=1977869 RepID=A0A430A0A2_9ENTE|nr:hypothetical protein [Vagococcus vulneris]RST99734.1 hypothetical protein CBF37_03135 [Vagococcus vulneris]